MAIDLEKLVAQLSVDIRGFEQGLARANGVSNKQFNAIERRAIQMNKKLDGIGRSAANNLLAPLSGIGAALGAREVLRYADAWTSAKNSLAVAGVVGRNQADVLDQLYNSAQANAAPIGALADLFGKAAQASDNLGASQSDLLKFSDGVATSLRVAGTSAGAASGALTQLGQLLGQARVQAEEFNSINEGARPILMAVAAGMDEAGGSVSKLKALVNDGKVSGQQFFQAFLRGLPQIEAMAANATQTIEQGVTKVNNAFTKYIGETDASLGASQRLVLGLNSLADNFDATADIVLKLAAVIAGALVGRSIVGMIRSLGLATTALLSLITALRTASGLSGAAQAFGGIGAAAGPLGMVIGGTVVGALALFSSTVGKSSEGATLFADRLKRLEEAAKASGQAVEEASQKNDAYSRNSLAQEVEASTTAFEDAQAEALNLLSAFAEVQAMSLITPEQYSELARLRDGLKDGSVSAEDAKQSLFGMANADYNFQEVADAIGPILDRLALISQGARDAASDLAKLTGDGGPSFRELDDKSMSSYRDMKAAGDAFIKEADRRNSLTKGQLALETEIAAVRKKAGEEGVILTEKQIALLAQSNIAADASRSAEGKKPKKEKKERDNDYEREIQSITERTAAIVTETEAQRQINPLVEEYGYAIEKARAEHDLLTAAQQAGIAVTPQLRAEIAATAEQYALATMEAGKLADSQDKIRQSAEEMAAFQKDLTGGIVDGLLSGASAAEVMSNAVGKLTDKLIEMGLSNIFDTAANGGAGFNLLSFLGLKLKDGGKVQRFASGGGVRGPGSSRSDSIPAMLSDGEFVVNAAATKRNRTLLEAINNGQSLMLAGGGMATLKAPVMPRLQSPAMMRDSRQHISIGVAMDENANLKAYVKNVSEETTKAGLKTYDKGGAVRAGRDLREVNYRGYAR